MAYYDPIYMFALLPFTLLLYQFLKKEYRYLALLLVSYVFVFLFSGKRIVFLILATLIVYGIGRFLGKQNDLCKEKVSAAGKDKELKKQIKSDFGKKKKRILIVGIIILIAMLVALKYFNFIIENINVISARVSEGKQIKAIKLLAPIGISYYSLQAIGYLTDVYWGKVEPEKNVFKMALFLAFFPTIVEGPICSYVDVKDQLFGGESLKQNNLVDGSMRILWGLFKKIVVADRLYVIVATLFDGEEKYTGAYIVMAAICYTVQLYMEFSGCIDIVIGSGKLFGIKLTENFRQPFLSKNASEFWRRWHISLGIWFKTYIFYPVSMSRLAKKWKQFGSDKLNKYFTKLGLSAIALFPVWFCNGLWHGPHWNYIFYGMYYFVILMLELILEPVKLGFMNKAKISEKNVFWNVFLVLKTWVIIFTGELFFRANTLKQGFDMFFSMFKNFRFSTFVDGSILKLGLSRGDFIAAVIGAIIVFAIGIIREKNEDILGTIRGMKLPLRWAIYITLIVSIIIFGAYGPGYQEVDMIYAGF